MQSLKFWKSKKFNEFREIFWPVLDPLEDTGTRPKFKLAVDDENIETVLGLAKKISEAEEDRRKGIESKAALFLSTISIATTLVVASNTMMNGKADSTFAFNISVIISFLLSIYTVRTVWFSIKALERGNYHVLGFKDVNVKGNKIEYTKKIIDTIVAHTRSNYDTVDGKVDDLSMAQAYYKRAIVIISIYAFWIVCYSLFFKKNDPVSSRPEIRKSVSIICNHDKLVQTVTKIPDTAKKTNSKKR